MLARGGSYLIEMADQRNLKQKQALADLHEANLTIEAALEENAGLHARLLVRAREAGVLDERQRTAREIHDTLAQGLAGILTQLQAAQQSPRDRDRHVTNAVSLARDSLVEPKHACAGRVGLTLSYMEGLVTLDVRDDGVGFDPGLFIENR